VSRSLKVRDGPHIAVTSLRGFWSNGKSPTPQGMNANATIPVTLWLNVAMLVLNSAIWLDNATRLAG